MTLSLYDATIPSYLQILGAMKHLLGKAEAHCTEHGLPHEALIGARLIDDMLPFSYQVKSTADHSFGAIEGLRAGVYSPSMAPPPDSFAALNEKIDGAAASLSALAREEVDRFKDRDMRFEFRDRAIPFTGETFLLSFSQPNFYFHAATAYGVLRAKGVKLGKMDFMGPVRARV